MSTSTRSRLRSTGGLVRRATLRLLLPRCEVPELSQQEFMAWLERRFSP
jgi:hypothetical protein